MLNHVLIGTNDVERAKRFYDPLLATLGVPEGKRDTLPSGTNRIIYRHNGISFVVTEPINGEPATVANGFTLGFRCDTSKQIHQFHDAGVANGGTVTEDAPGIRYSATGDVFYSSYVRDPDGNKLCAMKVGVDD